MNLSVYSKPGNEHDASAINGIFNYDVNNSEKYRIKVEEMNSQINDLEKSLGELRAKVQAYHDIILKYESVFREELLLYRLQKSKLTTIQDAFHEQELFAKEIEQHISDYLNESPPKNTRYSSFKRIVVRFFRQNRLNQSTANIKISEIEQLIDKKQQLLEKFQSDIKNWKKPPMKIAAPEAQQITLN
jgi:hypothetical protein